MDHIEEAQGELSRAIRYHGGNDAAMAEAEFALKLAQVNALIAIAKSLAKLAGAMDEAGLFHVQAA